jgi:excisionase family DNA binding protein
MMDDNEAGWEVLRLSPFVEEQLLTIPQAAAMLNMSRSTIYRLFDAGELSWVRIGSSRRVKATEINRLIAAQTRSA